MSLYRTGTSIYISPNDGELVDVSSGAYPSLDPIVEGRLVILVFRFDVLSVAAAIAHAPFECLAPQVTIGLGKLAVDPGASGTRPILAILANEKSACDSLRASISAVTAPFQSRVRVSRQPLSLTSFSSI
jgi:hypothetical protein